MILKMLKWSGNLCIVFVLLFSAMLFYSAFDAKNQPGQVPSVFGYKIMNVLSGSMEPLLSPGDILIAKEADPAEITIDDVIVYTAEEHDFVTHRVVDVESNNGEIVFTTKGDANNTHDQSPVSSEQLIGSLTLNIPKAGYAADFLTSTHGIIVLISLLSLIWVTGRLLKARQPKNKTPA